MKIWLLFSMIIIFLIGNLELRAQDLDTVTAKIRTLTRDTTTIYLLGTIHGAHARNPNYTWPHLDQIVTLCSPQLMLVEIRPEHFRPEEYYSDGPPEMAYLVHLASTRKVNCRGMDWWPDEWLYKMEKLTEADFNRRDTEMVNNILREIGTFRPRRTLVATGASHVDPFVALLNRQGYKEIESPPLDLHVSVYPDLPDSVVNLWLEGAKYLSGVSIGKTQRIQDKINFLKKIIDARGYIFQRKNK